MREQYIRVSKIRHCFLTPLKNWYIARFLMEGELAAATLRT